MSKMKKVFITFIVFIGLIAVGVGVYAYTIYNDIQKTTEVIHKPIKKSDKREEQVSVEKKQPFSILLLGVDHRPGDKGRSDSMILMTVNPTDNKTEIVSIPRDTRTTIVGKGKIDKINHAYAFGGVQMAVSTVENFLNIPIDYYVKVNMEGFQDIVNAVNGVEVMNDLDFTWDGNHFKKGKLHLNGKEALSFTRMRELDPRGDFGREMRQRQVIEAVLKRGASVSTLSTYTDVLKAIQNNIETNLTLNDMIAIQKDYREAASNVNEVQITGKGTKIDGIYYLQVSKEEQDQIATQLRQQLALQ
jgi:LCP family protein required for cell wall assembly